MSEDAHQTSVPTTLQENAATVLNKSDQNRDRLRIVIDGVDPWVNSRVFSADGEDLTEKLHIAAIEFKFDWNSAHQSDQYPPVKLQVYADVVIEGQVTLEQLLTFAQKKRAGEQGSARLKLKRSALNTFMPTQDQKNTDYPNTPWHRLARLGQRVYQDLVRDRAFRAAASGLAMDSRGLTPWMNDAVVLWLKARDWSSCRVFEFGTGASTVWWTEHAEQVYSVENDEFWRNQVIKLVAQQNPHLGSASNWSSCLRETRKEYIAEVIPLRKLDDLTNLRNGNGRVYVVDGPWRYEVVREILFQCFEDDALVILDNSDWYPRTREGLFTHPEWTAFDLIGRSPLVPYNTQTTIAWKGSLNRMAPMLPVAERGTYQLDKNFEQYLQPKPE